MFCVHLDLVMKLTWPVWSKLWVDETAVASSAATDLPRSFAICGIMQVGEFSFLFFSFLLRSKNGCREAVRHACNVSSTILVGRKAKELTGQTAT